MQNLFTNNTGHPSAGVGAVSAYQTAVEVNDTAFLYNSGQVSVLKTQGDSHVYFYNVTAAYGTASMATSLAGTTATFRFRNSTFRESATFNIPSGDVEISNCNSPNAMVGTGNTTADPLLDANGVPASNSPAINAGNNSYLPTDVADVDGDGNTSEVLPLDLAGNARIQGGTVDMGAYEVQ